MHNLLTYSAGVGGEGKGKGKGLWACYATALLLPGVLCTVFNTGAKEEACATMFRGFMKYRSSSNSGSCLLCAFLPVVCSFLLFLGGGRGVGTADKEGGGTLLGSVSRLNLQSEMCPEM